MNSLYSIMAIAAILSLSFCKDDKDDPEPNPMPMEEDPAGITYSQQDKSEFPETFTLTEEDSNSNMVEYTIVLNTQPTANVEIEITLPSDAPSNLSIASGSQNESGAGSSITLTYTTDNWNNSQTVTLTLTDDTMSSSINGSLTHIVTSGDPNYNNKDTLNRTITLKLRDSEAGVLYQKDNASLPETIELTEGTDSEYSYMIVLAKQPTDDVTIQISLSVDSPDNLRIDEGGTPVTFTSIIFSVDEWDMPQTINLTFTDNDNISGPIMSALTHITSSTDAEYDSLPNKNLIIRLIDDESPCIQAGAGTETGFNPPTIPGENYGTGAMDDPYIICNSNQLQAMKDDLDAHYELGQDIDASSISTDTCPAGTTGTCTGFQPIGDCGVDGHCDNADDMPFTGTLDGKGFTISDLRININLTSDDSYAGLFGATSGTNIRNIGLLNVDISSSSDCDSFAGGLVGRNSSSSITNSYSTGNVSSSADLFSYAGGLVGENISSSITNSYSTGNVSPSVSSRTQSHAGGLVGRNSSSSITNSYSTGNVFSSAPAFQSNTGGLVGENDSSSITNSYSTGNVSSSAAANSITGGLVGNNFSSSITNSYSTGNASSSTSSGSSVSYAGGLVGINNSSSSITNSYSTGNASSSTSLNFSNSFAGGLAGRNSSSSSITNSYYDQNTSTLSENGSEVSDTAVGSGSNLTCVGGFATSQFIAPTTPNTGSCSPLAIFFNWQTPFDIDGNSVADEESVRYDSNNDGSVNNMDDFIWNFGSNTEYPFIASIPQTADEQAVRMASGFLRFSNTILGEPSSTDPVFFYDIGDAAMDITTSGQNVQGTTANGYEIQDADGNALASPAVNASGVISGINSGPAEFYLKVTFTRGASPDTASYTRRYKFKK